MARSVVDALLSEPMARAPSGFAGRVMESVYREALWGGPARPVGAEEMKARGEGLLSPGRIYRRLGFSFVLTAVVLSATVFLPRVSYTALAGASGVMEAVSPNGGRIVRSALHEASLAVRDAIHAGNGGMRR